MRCCASKVIAVGRHPFCLPVSSYLFIHLDLSDSLKENWTASHYSESRRCSIKSRFIQSRLRGPAERRRAPGKRPLFNRHKRRGGRGEAGPGRTGRTLQFLLTSCLHVPLSKKISTGCVQAKQERELAAAQGQSFVLLEALFGRGLCSLVLSCVQATGNFLLRRKLAHAEGPGPFSIQSSLSFVVCPQTHGTLR